MSESLLIVDDEPNILRALTRLFRETPYNIFTAISGEEGLNLLAQNDIQVIISDHRMPSMSGSEFLNEVKKNYPDTIRIILSGYADFDIIKNALSEGLIYKCVTKPWDDEVFRHHVYEAFQTYNLQNKNKWGKQVLENSLEGVIITDGKNKIIQANHAYINLSGLSELEIIGKKFILSPEHHSNPKPCTIKSHLKKKGSWHGELWMKGPKKKSFPAWLSITAIFDNNHRAIQYTYIIVDISKQKEQEQLLAQQILLMILH